MKQDLAQELTWQHGPELLLADCGVIALQMDTSGGSPYGPNASHHKGAAGSPRISWTHRGNKMSSYHTRRIKLGLVG